MSIRKRFLLLGSLLLGAALLFTYSPLHVPKALASDNNGEHICWGANPSYCMDLKDDAFQNGQPVYLWSAVNGTANGLGWHRAPMGNVNDNTNSPFANPAINFRYNGDAVYWLEKTTATGHNGCIGVNANAWHLAWYDCGDTTTLWVYSAYGYLVNVAETDFAGGPEAAGVCNAVGDATSITLDDPTQPGCAGSWSFVAA